MILGQVQVGGLEDFPQLHAEVYHRCIRTKRSRFIVTRLLPLIRRGFSVYKHHKPWQFDCVLVASTSQKGANVPSRAYRGHANVNILVVETAVVTAHLLLQKHLAGIQTRLSQVYSYAPRIRYSPGHAPLPSLAGTSQNQRSPPSPAQRSRELPHGPPQQVNNTYNTSQAIHRDIDAQFPATHT